MSEAAKDAALLAVRSNAAADEIEMLRTAISETLDENGHLADGDNCTLIKLLYGALIGGTGGTVQKETSDY